MTAVKDLVFVVGVVLLVYGIYLTWVPGAYIAGGLLLMFQAYLWEVTRNDRQYTRKSD